MTFRTAFLAAAVAAFALPLAAQNSPTEAELTEGRALAEFLIMGDEPAPGEMTPEQQEIANRTIVIDGVVATTTDPEIETVDQIMPDTDAPIYIRGNVVIGENLPSEVEVTRMPETGLTRVMLNGANVVLKPEGQAVVRLLR